MAFTNSRGHAFRKVKITLSISCPSKRGDIAIAQPQDLQENECHELKLRHCHCPTTRSLKSKRYCSMKPQFNCQPCKTWRHEVNELNCHELNCHELNITASIVFAIHGPLFKCGASRTECQDSEARTQPATPACHECANRCHLIRLKRRVAGCCSALQCVAMCCRVLPCVAVCCSELQCVAVCCSVLQCESLPPHTSQETCCRVLQCVAMCCSVLQCVAVCCSVLQCVAVCCSVLQCVAVCCSVLQCELLPPHTSQET